MKLPQSQSHLGRRDLFFLASPHYPQMVFVNLSCWLVYWLAFMAKESQALGSPGCTVGSVQGYEAGLAVPPSIRAQSRPV